jgi:hypothetical protein
MAFYIALVALIGEQHEMTHKYKVEDLKKKKASMRIELKMQSDFLVLQGFCRSLNFMPERGPWSSPSNRSSRSNSHKATTSTETWRKMYVNCMAWLPKMQACAYRKTIHWHSKRKNRRNAFLAPYERRQWREAPEIDNINPQRNKIFESFSIGIASIQVRTASAKVGHPPSVQRDGHEVIMRVSYHLRGMCSPMGPKLTGWGGHGRVIYVVELLSGAVVCVAVCDMAKNPSFVCRKPVFKFDWIWFSRQMLIRSG